MRDVFSAVGWKRLLGNHSVDAALTGGVLTGEEKLELQPAAEADDHGIGNITRSSGVTVEKELARNVGVRVVWMETVKPSGMAAKTSTEERTV